MIKNSATILLTILLLSVSIIANAEDTTISNDFQSYNITKVYSAANTVNSDLNFWKIMFDNGKLRYNGFWSNRIVNGAYDSDLETLKAENLSKYNTVYGGGAYQGTANSNTGATFNYKGVPIATGLPGWYGYISNAPHFQEMTDETRMPLNVVCEVGNTSNKVLQMGVSYTGSNAFSLFGKYDFKLDEYTVFKTKIKFPSPKQAKSLKLSLTQGEPTKFDETTEFYGSDIIASNNSAVNNILGVSNGDLIGKAANFKFTNLITKGSFDKMYDVLSFSEGNMYFGPSKTLIGNYIAYSSDWYTIYYTIDNRGDTSKNALTIVDANNSVVASVPFCDMESSVFCANSGSDVYGLQYLYTGYSSSDNCPKNSNLYSQADYFSYGVSRIYLDDIEIKKAEPLILETDVTQFDTDKVPFDESSDLTLAFTKPLVTSSVSNNTVNVTDVNNNLINIKVSVVDSNKLKIVFPKLIPISRYTINISNKILANDFSFADATSFHVYTKDEAIISGGITSVADNKANVTLNVKNDEVSSRKYLVMLMVYDGENNALSGAYYRNAEVSAKGNEQLAFSDIKYNTGNVIKAYVFNDFVDFKAACSSLIIN